MQNILAGRINLRDTRVLDQLFWTNHMNESVSHLQAPKSHGFDHCCLLLLILKIDYLSQDRCGRLWFLDMHTKVDDETENIVVTVVDARDKWCHSFQVLDLKHLD